MSAGKAILKLPCPTAAEKRIRALALFGPYENFARLPKDSVPGHTMVILRLS